MINRIGDTLRFECAYVASAVGATGLTVTCDVYRNNTLVVTAGSASELGGGVYYYSLSNTLVTVAGVYTAVFKTSGTADQKWQYAVRDVGTTWVEFVDASIAALGSPLQASGYTAPDNAGVAAIQALITALHDITAQDVWEYVTRTLTSGGATAADIWDYLTSDADTPGSMGALLAAYVDAKISSIVAIVATSETNPKAGTALTLTNRVTFEQDIESLTIPADWTKCQLTVKSDVGLDDSMAKLQLQVSNPADVDNDGIVILHKTTAGANRTLGSLTVDQPNGTVTLHLDNGIDWSGQIGRGTYDVKFTDGGGNTSKPATSAEFVVKLTETRTN